MINSPMINSPINQTNNQTIKQEIKQANKQIIKHIKSIQPFLNSIQPKPKIKIENFVLIKHNTYIEDGKKSRHYSLK